MTQKGTVETTVVSNDEKLEEKLEGETNQIERTWLLPAEIQHRFDTLRDLSDEQMAALDKKVLRKIDWRLMPCITLMFLMKYAFRPNKMRHIPTDDFTAISIVSTSPTLVWRVFRKISTCLILSGMRVSVRSTSDISLASYQETCGSPSPIPASSCP